MSAIGEPARKAIPRFLKLAGAGAVADGEVVLIHEEKKQIFERSLVTAHLVPLQAVVPVTDGKSNLIPRYTL